MDPKEFERVLQDRQKAKKAAQIAATDIRKAVGADGKVRIWHFVEQRWKRIWPVDAAEQIRMGLAALEVVEMIGPDGPQMVAKDQIEERQIQGWQHAAAKSLQEPTAPVEESEPAVADVEPSKGKRRSDRPAK